MSLLLDALRRAAASKQAPEDDQFVVPRRDDALLEPEQEMPEVPLLTPDPGDEAPLEPLEGVGSNAEDAADETGLSLEPEGEADEPAPIEGEDPDAPQPVRGPAGRPPEAGPPGSAAPLATAALLSSRPRAPRSWRGVLPAVALTVVLAAALAFGGWWYYLDSRDAVEQGLAAYRPVAEPLVELSPGAEPDTAPAPSTAAGDAPAVGTEAATPEPEPVTDTAPTAAAADDEPAVTAEGSAVAAVTGSASPDATATQAAPEPEAPAAEAAQPPPRAEPERSEPQSQPRSAQPLVQSSRPSTLSQALQSGYAALRAGDLETASREYGVAIERAPDNRDALLGLATIAQRRGEPERAAGLYRRVLADHPRDPTARAGLASLAAAFEPRRSETELKRLLSEQPDSPALQHALGNLYAAESRWSEAQRAFFEAYRAEPANPEYAYNLAVALDHLGQREPALAHYRRALTTATPGAVSFSLEAVRRRIAQLQ